MVLQNALREHYNIALTEPAHRAMPDVHVLAQIFAHVLDEIGHHDLSMLLSTGQAFNGRMDQIVFKASGSFS